MKKPTSAVEVSAKVQMYADLFKNSVLRFDGKPRIPLTVGVDVAKEGGDYSVSGVLDIDSAPVRWCSVQFMTDRMRATAKAIDEALVKAQSLGGEAAPPLTAMNEGWCLGCKQRGGECQCAELGTDPEWVEEEPK